LELGDYATAKTNDVKHFDIYIPILGHHGDHNEIVAYAEIWGSTLSGTMKPIVWISGISKIENNLVLLHAHVNWFDTELLPPFTLKNVRIQDANYHIVLSQKDSIPLELELDDLKMLTIIPASYEEMTNGPRPSAYRLPENISFTAEEAPIILSHGRNLFTFSIFLYHSSRILCSTASLYT
jgi:hypothetical protein